MSLRAELRVPAGTVDLSAVPTSDTPGFHGGKQAGKAALAALGPELMDLQERLFACGRAGDARRVLLVLQGMDTAGKGGTLKHTVGLVDPQGVRITSFGPPTPEELAQDFLWRVRRAVPEPGYIGVFDRSHYEDVLVGKVRGLADAAEIERRYAAIVDFEAELVASGVTVIKCLLHLGADEQRARIEARLDTPEKHWKYDPGDVDDRSRWAEYQAAYEVAVERTNTEHAPWYLIPSDRKWYRNLAVGRILYETLDGMGLTWPVGDFDVEVERKRLAAALPGDRP